MECDAANYCCCRASGVCAAVNVRCRREARVCRFNETQTAGASLIVEGQAAPDFDLETDEGTRVSLASMRGRKVVLFFYPKDNTSG